MNNYYTGYSIIITDIVLPGAWCRQEDEVVEQEADQLLLRFCLLQSSAMEEFPRAHRVCQRVEGDLLLERLLLGGEVQVDLEPLQPLRVLLHPHPLHRGQNSYNLGDA